MSRWSMLWVIAGAATVSCTTDNRAADVAAIKAQSAGYLKADQEKDLEGALSYYAEDAALLPPDAPIITGKADIRTKFFQPLLSDPRFAITWESLQVEAAQSAEIGFERGRAELTVSKPDGSPNTIKLKFVRIWKKEAGKPNAPWLNSVAIFNRDQP